MQSFDKSSRCNRDTLDGMLQNNRCDLHRRLVHGQICLHGERCSKRSFRPCLIARESWRILSRAVQFLILSNGFDPLQRFCHFTERGYLGITQCSSYSVSLKSSIARMNTLLKEGFRFPDDFHSHITSWSPRIGFLRPKRLKVLNTSPDLLSVVPRFRDRPESIQQFWNAAKWVKDNERSKVLFVKGPKGSGRKDIILSVCTKFEQCWSNGLYDFVIP